MMVILSHIRASNVKKAYKNGARWSHKDARWLVDNTNEEIKLVIYEAKSFNMYGLDMPQLLLDDRVDAIVDEEHPIQNIFLCNPQTYKCKNTSRRNASYLYYRADCKCELCKVPVRKNKYLKSYEIYHEIIYEPRCKVYRCVCLDCYKLTTLSLSKPLDEIYVTRYLDLSGLTREEFYKLLVDRENGIIQ